MVAFLAPIAWFIGTTIAYLGIDWGIRQLFPEAGVTYVEGMTAAEFFSELWPLLIFLSAFAILCFYLSFPSKKSLERASGGR